MTSLLQHVECESDLWHSREQRKQTARKGARMKTCDYPTRVFPVDNIRKFPILFRRVSTQLHCGNGADCWIACDFLSRLSGREKGSAQEGVCGRICWVWPDSLRHLLSQDHSTSPGLTRHVRRLSWHGPRPPGWLRLAGAGIFSTLLHGCHAAASFWRQESILASARRVVLTRQPGDSGGGVQSPACRRAAPRVQHISHAPLACRFREMTRLDARESLQ